MYSRIYRSAQAASMVTDLSPTAAESGWLVNVLLMSS
jgi:hypothetical protein